MYLPQKQFLKILRSSLRSTEAGEFVCAAQLDVKCCVASPISFKHEALGGHADSFLDLWNVNVCWGKTDNSALVLSPNHATGSRCSPRDCLKLPAYTGGTSGSTGAEGECPTYAGTMRNHPGSSYLCTWDFPTFLSQLSNKRFLVLADFFTVCQNRTTSALYCKCLTSRIRLSLS